MSKEVIHIYGASGSGTTTLAKYLRDQRGFFFMDSDDYYWLPVEPPYTRKRNPEERLRLMRQDIDRAEKAVISGSLTGWGDELIPLFTLAVRLETDTDIRIRRLRERERAHFGNRIAPGGDMYENHEEFIRWASGYDFGDISMRSRAHHDEWEKKLCCRKIVLNGNDSLAANLERIDKCR